MRCPKEKRLVLFYYQELKDSELKTIKHHLKQCQRCLDRYNSMESFLARLDVDPIQLKGDDLEIILQNVKKRIHNHSLRSMLKDRIDVFLDNLRLGLFYKRALIPAAVILFVFLGILPFMAKQTREFKNNLDILEIEIELSSDNLEGSVFDFYEEEFLFMEEMSGLSRSVYHS